MYVWNCFDVWLRFEVWLQDRAVVAGGGVGWWVGGEIYRLGGGERGGSGGEGGCGGGEGGGAGDGGICGGGDDGGGEGGGGNGSGGEGGGNGGGGEGDCGCGEGDGGEGEGTVHRAEWCYAASAAEGLSDREAGIINYLRGLNITPCLTYLLARSLEPEPDPTPSLEPTQPAPDTTSPLPSKRSELATLTIDVGAFAIEVVATRGAVSGISLVHESDSNPHPNPHPDPKSNPSPNSDQVHESGRRETVSPSSGEVELRCPQVQAPAAVPAPGPAAPAAPAAESGGAAAGAAGGVAGGAVGTVPALGLTFRPVSGHALVVSVEVP